MPDIDESSERFGSLTAKVDQLLDGQKYDRGVRNEMAIQIQGIASTQSANLENTKENRMRLEKLEPLVSEHEKWRQRGIGAIMFASAIAGIIGAAIYAVTQRIFGFR